MAGLMRLWRTPVPGSGSEEVLVSFTGCPPRDRYMSIETKSTTHEEYNFDNV